MFKLHYNRERKENFTLYLVFTFIVVLAFSLRLYQLDERVFHHDEAAVGVFTYELFSRGTYSYNPSFHGPFMYYATADVFRFFGDSVHSARLLPTLFGAAIILLLVPLRKYIGNGGLIISGFFFALSPSFLYYSRFYREDIFISFFTLLTLVCAVKYIESYIQGRYSYLRIFYLFLAALALASMSALKENAYVSIALIAAFFLLFSVRKRMYKGLAEKLKSGGKGTLVTVAEGLFFIAVFLIIFSLFYTGNVLDLYGMKVAVEKALSHWAEVHAVKRLGGPVYFYLPIMALYELPVLAFGTAGIIHYYREKNLLMSFLGYWAIANLIVYSYFQEKVPWLVLNPLLPLTVIAGSYLGEILPRLKPDSRRSAAVIIFVFMSLSYFAYSSVLLNYYNYASPAEPLVQAGQPPQRFSEFLDKFFEISSQYSYQETYVQLIDDGMATQMLWYMRHYSKIMEVNEDSQLNAPLVVANDSEADAVQLRLGSGYVRFDSARASWYRFKLSDITPGYLLYREMDRPPREYRFALFYRPRLQFNGD